MIGNGGVEIIVKDTLHGLDMHRVAVVFEDIIDTVGRIIYPSIDLAAIAGFKKTMGVHDMELIHVFSIADNMVIGMFSCGSVKIAGDDIGSDAEIPARMDQFFTIIVLFIKAMMPPAQMHIGDMQ